MGLCFLCRCVGSMTGPASDVSTTQFYWDNDVTQDKPDPDVWSHLGGLTLQQDQQDVSFIFNSIKKTQEPENRSQESQILNEKDKTRLNYNCNSVANSSDQPISLEIPGLPSLRHILHLFWEDSPANRDTVAIFSPGQVFFLDSSLCDVPGTPPLGI